MTATADWPVTDFGARIFDAAAVERAGVDVFEHGDGVVTPIPWRRWQGTPDRADRGLLARVSRSALDLGCGPGRLAVALTRRGVATLGIDITPEAVRLTRAAGGFALHRSVFAPIPGEGTWACALLADGNIGIGGDPIALLRRVRELLAVDGRAFVEVASPSHALHVGPARIRCADGYTTDWFGWARVPVTSVGLLAGVTGFGVREIWHCDGRWFAALARR
jgi:SAM-dependent methyltransferase